MNTEQIVIYTLIGAVAVSFSATVVRAHFRQQFIINEGVAGLLYHEGKLSETLVAGRHVRWGKNFRIALVDVRKSLLQVAGQEVLSADNVGVKLSIVLTTQIVDAGKSVQAADNHVGHIYSATQTAVRTVVAGVTMEALLTQRVAIGAHRRELIAPQADAVGVEVHAVDVRDVMLPGELRKAFSEVLKAKQEGQAALERARGESAALRNLANAAPYRRPAGTRDTPLPANAPCPFYSEILMIRSRACFTRPLLKKGIASASRDGRRAHHLRPPHECVPFNHRAPDGSNC